MVSRLSMLLRNQVTFHPRARRICRQPRTTRILRFGASGSVFDELDEACRVMTGVIRIKFDQKAGSVNLIRKVGGR